MNPSARHLARLSTAFFLVLVTACGALPGETVLLGPKDVGATGGTVYSLDGNAYVVVPPGAISLGQTLRISVEPADASPPDSFGTAVGVAYRFEPSGTRFNSLVTLHTKYDENDLPAGVGAYDLDLVLQSGDTGEWATMAEVVTNPEQQTISGKTSHFSIAAQVIDDSGLPSFEGFAWPFAGGLTASTISQMFGHYEEVFAEGHDPLFADKHHTGIDIVANGALVRSIGPGRVWKIGPYPTGECQSMPGSSGDDDCRVYGNAVMIKHTNGLFSIYGHLESFSAPMFLGEEVFAGTPLGTEGNSRTGARHLHLELRSFDEWSYPGEKDALAGERGNGYTIPHPSYGGHREHYYIDPLLAMPELAGNYAPESSPFVVRTIANGVGANLRPAPGYAYAGAASYRRDDGDGNQGLKLDETLEVVATAQDATTLGCELWYEVRPVVHEPSLTRWVPDATDPDRELYFLVTAQLGVSESSVRTAWVCAEDRVGDLFAIVGGGDPDGTPSWSFSPSSLSFQTPVGAGPIAPRTLVVENAGDAAGTVMATVDYGASGGWLSVSPTSLTLNAGESGTLTASAAGCTGTGSRSATINLSGGGDVVQVPVTLTCAEAPDPGILSVSPTTTWSISGTQGGPFSSTSRVYTLQNTGASSLSWEADESEGWLGTSGTTSGTLQAGASTTVTFVLDQIGSTSASELSPGTYSTFLRFINHTGGLEIRRTAQIIVEAPELLPVTELISNGTFTYRTGWSTTGDAWIWNGTSDSSYRTGPGYAALGVDTDGNHINDALGFITQAVAVPAGATNGRFSLYYNMTSTEPSASADVFPLAITTTPCIGTNQFVTGFSLNASHAHQTVGSYVRRYVDFDATEYAGENLCVVLASQTNATNPTILRLDDVSLTVWGE